MTPNDSIRTVGVIGAGQMGSGIAHVCALAGYGVRLTDVTDEALQRGVQAIDKNLERQVARGKVKEDDRRATIGRIKTGLDYAMFGDCEIVIEAASEKE